MSDVLGSLVSLLAQAQPKAPAAEPSGSIWAMLLPFLPAVILFYFMIIRPQQRQEKLRRQMLETLRKNDKVLTAAGIYGTVVSVDGEGDRVVVRVDDDKGLKLTFSKASIVRVLGGPEREKETEKPAVAAGGPA
jgi:preprotein translocase subunit YajC